MKGGARAFDVETHGPDHPHIEEKCREREPHSVKPRTASARQVNPSCTGDGLAVCNVSHNFGSQNILEELNFSIKSGEHLALMGPSGCGKSTLLRLISGLEEVQSGFISLNGRLLSAGKTSDHSPFHLPPETRRVGMVFQDHALFPHLTALGNVLFPMSRLKQRVAHERAHELLSAVGLATFSHRYPQSLSGGQRQRLALARTLAQDAELILLDEPFSGLDPALRESVRTQTRKLLEQRNLTSLLVTHDPSEALGFGDKVMVMNEGRVIQIGTPTEIKRRPRSLAIARLLWDVRPVLCLDGSTCTAAELAHVLELDQKTLGASFGCSTANAGSASHSLGCGTHEAQSKTKAYLSPSGLLPLAASGLAHLRRPHTLSCSIYQTQVMNEQVLVTLEATGGAPERRIRLQTLVPLWLMPPPDAAPDSETSPFALNKEAQEWALDLERLFYFSE